jgi:very-long-chain (3R)-3-hydroxyacyl-CoA dehydratase
VLQVTQTAAVLEIFHAAAGLVRSPLTTTVQQVASRIFVVWGILFAVPEVAGKSIALFRWAPSLSVRGTGTGTP